jgi:hypothetical protein
MLSRARAQIKERLMYHWSLDSYSMGVLFWEVFTNLVGEWASECEWASACMGKRVWLGEYECMFTARTHGRCCAACTPRA